MTANLTVNNQHHMECHDPWLIRDQRLHKKHGGCVLKKEIGTEWSPKRPRRAQEDFWRETGCGVRQPRVKSAPMRDDAPNSQASQTKWTEIKKKKKKGLFVWFPSTVTDPPVLFPLSLWFACCSAQHQLSVQKSLAGFFPAAGCTPLIPVLDTVHLPALFSLASNPPVVKMNRRTLTTQ